VVVEEQLTRDQLRAIDRRQQIEIARGKGDHESAEWIRAKMEYDDEATPEEDAEDLRIVAERTAKGDYISCEEAERQLDDEFPEDAEFFQRLDGEFPDWPHYLRKIPADSPPGAAFFRKLNAEFPEAVELFEAFR